MTSPAPRRMGKSLLANAKVTEAQVRAVRSLYEFAGFKRDQLMERFDLDKGAIDRITSGKTGANIFVSVKDLPPDVEPLPQYRKPR